MGTLHLDFSDDVAVVTGGASGIGLEIVCALHQAGARVSVLDRQGPAVQWSDDGPRFYSVDLRRSAEVEHAIAAIVEKEGRIDHLVNNAGITRDGVLWKLDDTQWDEVIDVNLSGAFRTLRAVVPHMRKRGFGRVVQVSSINGLRGRFGQANYSASKAGLIGLTRSAARELGAFGITVNAVAPGMIDTPMTAKLPPEVRERSLKETATGRLGQPADVVGLVLFLLCEQAAHITGEVIRVDGGQLA